LATANLFNCCVIFKVLVERTAIFPDIQAHCCEVGERLAALTFFALALVDELPSHALSDDGVVDLIKLFPALLGGLLFLHLAHWIGALHSHTIQVLLQSHHQVVD